jgi:preprotein translocase subunit SecG
MTFLFIIILIICVLLGVIVLAQNPKGGGLASGFTGAQQIGGVQKTADFLEKSTWTLATALLALCLVSAAFYSGGGAETDPFDEEIVAPADFDPTQDVDATPPAEPEVDPAGEPGQ